MYVSSNGEIFAAPYSEGIWQYQSSSWTAMTMPISLHRGSVNEFTGNAQGDVFAATEVGVYRLLSGTTAWEKVGQYMYTSINKIIIVPNRNVFAINSSEGVFRSTDGGITWTEANTGLSDVGISDITANPLNGNIFVTTWRGIFRSTNNGAQWDSVNTGITNRNIAALSCNQTNGNMYAISSGFQRLLYTSTNNGDTWSSMQVPATDQYLNLKALDIAPNGDIFVGTWGEGVSRYSGSQWIKVNTGLPNNAIVEQLVIASQDTIYARLSGSLYRTTNNGSSWSLLGTFYSSSLAVNSLHHVFVGISNGIQRSTNNGATWEMIENDTNPVQALAFDADGYLYAGTSHGTIKSASVLPVELTRFYYTYATVSGQNEVHLHWMTATEINNYGFDIERKKYAFGTWERIGFVQGSGTTYAPKEYSFTDRFPKSKRIVYRLKQLDRDGESSYSDEIEVTIKEAIPEEFEVNVNPNPFNPTTRIEFMVPSTGLTTLKIYNSIGQEVAILFNNVAEVGQYHQTVFDGSQLSSGIYFVRLQHKGKSLVRKLLLTK